MKYDLHSRVMYPILKSRLTEYLETVIGKAKTNEIIRKGKKEYKKMILRTEDIGGNDNMNYSAFLTAAILFSVYKVSDHVITEKIFKDMVDNLAHWPKLLEAYARINEFSEQEINKRVADAKRSQKTQNPSDWNYHFEVVNQNKHKITYTRCGICELAKQEHCFEVAKYLCRMDYITYEQKGAVLTRTKTLADGDAMCNFVLTRK